MPAFQKITLIKREFYCFSQKKECKCLFIFINLIRLSPKKIDPQSNKKR